MILNRDALRVWFLGKERCKVITHCISHLVRAAATCSFSCRTERMGLVRVQRKETAAT